MAYSSDVAKEAVHPDYKLLPTVIDHVARMDPERIFCSVPVTSNLEDGLRDITFRQLSNAADALRSYLESELTRSSSFETLAYVGVNDIRYSIFLIACIKTGYKALFVSPRNAPDANAHLLTFSQCANFYTSVEHEKIATEASKVASGNVRVRVLAPFDHWLSSYLKPYPYKKTFEEARYDPILVLHSSGSTGPPKPIVENHQFFINYTKETPSKDGRRSGIFQYFDYEGGGYFITVFPFCHLAGVLSSTFLAPFSRSASYMTGFSDRPAIADTVLKLLRLRRTRTLFAPPSIIEGIAKIPSHAPVIEKLDNILFAGGPLSTSWGDRLSKSVTLSSSFGSTEAGTLLSFRPSPENWQYEELNPVWKPTFEEDTPGVYELVYYKDDEADQWRPIGATILRNEPVFRTKDISDTDDMFIHGLDSIEAAEIARSLRLAFGSYKGVADMAFLRSRFLFDHPTIEKSAAALKARWGGKTQECSNTISPSRMIAKYENFLRHSGLLDHSIHRISPHLSKIAITGTTGSLGSQILDLLIETVPVAQIICLNRNPSAQQDFEKNGHGKQSKVSFMTIDLAKEDLGLSKLNLESLEAAHAFIHCAWEVNFSRSLATFENQISALTNIIKICLSGPHITRLHFVSSISAIPLDSPIVESACKVPATLVTEPDDTRRMGYAVSKNVGEHLVASASEAYGLRASVLRVGQIAGCLPTNTSPVPWNRKEWVPSLVDTSSNLGKIPLGLPPVDWVPVDVVAQVVLDAVINGASVASTGFEVLNVVNPRKTLWDPLAVAIKACIQTPCDLVPFEQWLRALEHEDEAQSADLEKLPSLKTLRFLQQQEKSDRRDFEVDVSQTCEVSRAFATLRPIDEDQMKTWMAQWGYK